MARSDNTVKAIPGNQKHTTTFTSGDYYSEGSAKQMVMKRETGRMPWMGKRKEEQRVQHGLIKGADGIPSRQLYASNAVPDRWVGELNYAIALLAGR